MEEKKVLSKSEVQQLYKSISKGDLAARNFLIEKNLKLVTHIAKQFRNDFLEMDDLISEGIIGLIKAVDTYDGNKNNEFSTYIGACIRNEILMLIRKSKKHRNNVSLDKKIIVNEKNNDEVSFESFLGTDPDLLYDTYVLKLKCILVREALLELSEADRDLIERRYGLNGGPEVSQKVFIKELGLSQAGVSKKFFRIRKKMGQMEKIKELQNLDV